MIRVEIWEDGSGSGLAYRSGYPFRFYECENYEKALEKERELLEDPKVRSEVERGHWSIRF